MCFYDFLRQLLPRKVQRLKPRTLQKPQKIATATVASSCIVARGFRRLLTRDDGGGRSIYQNKPYLYFFILFRSDQIQSIKLILAKSRMPFFYRRRFNDCFIRYIISTVVDLTFGQSFVNLNRERKICCTFLGFSKFLRF